MGPLLDSSGVGQRECQEEEGRGKLQWGRCSTAAVSGGLFSSVILNRCGGHFERPWRAGEPMALWHGAALRAARDSAHMVRASDDRSNGGTEVLAPLWPAENGDMRLSENGAGGGDSVIARR